MSLPQNLERTDTKKWLNEVMDVLFRWILNTLMMVMAMLMIMRMEEARKAAIYVAMQHRSSHLGLALQR